jgi:hypothetical protein
LSETEDRNLFFHACHKATKGLIALSPEMNYDQTAMGLPPATAVFLIAVILIKGVSEEYLKCLW